MEEAIRFCATFYRREYEVLDFVHSTHTLNETWQIPPRLGPNTRPKNGSSCFDSANNRSSINGGVQEEKFWEKFKAYQCNINSPFLFYGYMTENGWNSFTLTRAHQKYDQKISQEEATTHVEGHLQPFPPVLGLNPREMWNLKFSSSPGHYAV